MFKGLTGIVLAGGKSKRMGSPKGLLPFGGRKLIEHSIDILQPLCEQIIISANEAYYDFLDHRIVKDEVAYCGPMGGILSCMKHSGMEDHLVLSVDTPFVSTDFLEKMYASRGESDIVVPWHGGKFYEPLIAYYRQSMVTVLSEFVEAGNTRIPDVFEKVNISYFKVSEHIKENTEQFFLNINKKEDYQEIINLIK